MTRDTLRLLTDARPARLDRPPTDTDAEVAAILARATAPAAGPLAAASPTAVESDTAPAGPTAADGVAGAGLGVGGGYPGDRPPGVDRRLVGVSGGSGDPGKSANRGLTPWVATAVATAAAVTVLVVSVPRTAPDHATPVAGPVTLAASPPSGGAVPSPRTILLAAAEVSARQSAPPATGGRYWADRREGAHVERASMKGKQFDVLVRFREEFWNSRRTDVPGFYVYQELGAVPASPADAAIIRSLGSPSRYGTGQRVPTDPNDPNSPTVPFEYDTKPGRVSVVEQPSTPLALPHAGIRYDRLDSLPTEPAALKALLAKEAIPNDPSSMFAMIFRAASLPVSPAVRSALLEILAGLPGASSAGEVRDAKGRPAETIVLPFGKGTESWYLIDAKTGAPLGVEVHRTDDRAYTTYDLGVSAGWEDQPPGR
ncbi:CU044_5270 family protein [Cryptosporangium phraense]|uniref:CU044_5270 family protein n=1 Tax=Cryptosporangium phraense TaxID=2593070 RepID=A0A545AVY9_9ACTN|nr:CU044_5270 family protein [Cryptosporangium phraense]TQS44765.1 hypothetical protein FL583_12435 [Cryptosporangium phraense]